MNDLSSTSATHNLSLSKKVNKSSSNLNVSFNTNDPSKKQTVKASKTLINEIHKAPFYPPGLQTMPGKSLKKTIAENNMVPYENEKSTLYSTWTPLSDEKSNHKLYEERKQLMNKWFETWNETQRKQAIEELMTLCKPRQLLYAREVLNKISPVYNIDFTRVLPRVICLYIFSFLDPRSLCRCAQVCWYWKMLAESDQIWMPKCLRFGWNLNYIPTSFESGIWKQFYIENIKALQYTPLSGKKGSTIFSNQATPGITERSEISLHDLSSGRFGFSRFIKSNGMIGAGGHNRPKTASSALKQPPWKANNSNPNHFYRLNYLDEKDPIVTTTTKPPPNSTTNSKKTTHLNDTSMSQKNYPDEHQQIQQVNKENIEAYSKDTSKLNSLFSKGQHLINELNSSQLKHDVKTGMSTQPVGKHADDEPNKNGLKQVWALLDNAEDYD